jgi:hypothetical protein
MNLDDNPGVASAARAAIRVCKERSFTILTILTNQLNFVCVKSVGDLDSKPILSQSAGHDIYQYNRRIRLLN